MANTSGERTTPTGLFHFAESYRTCAESLMRSPPKSLRFEDPMWFLAYHALELYLKSFLLHHGSSLNDLRLRYRHSLAKLWEAAKTGGIVIATDPGQLLQYLDEGGLIAHRYIVTGAQQRPDPQQVMELLEALRVAVLIDLQSGGAMVRFEDHALNGWSRD
ncbi:hypothetical protein D3C72_900360 [compost metagenome]